MSIFPIRLKSVGGERELNRLFIQTKPKDMIYYAFDTIIHSAKEIEFIVYDMDKSFFGGGGVGKELHRYKVQCDPLLTQQPIENRLYQIAMERRAKELDKIEQDMIEKYYREEKNKYLDSIL